ncbi:MAG: twin transmembrane helix small protein [Gammaproteobacteria bacterium]|nr:twin transmembrane helix small protein [Gammaproteobacteria bacterium]
MKYIVFILLAAIVVSLGRALFFLSREDAEPSKMLNALKLRVALSATLILFLLGAYLMGWLQS